jgi:hypothetical protein
MGLIGLALGTFVRKQLLVLPAIVAAAVLLHATAGRYPLMPRPRSAANNPRTSASPGTSHALACTRSTP